MPMEQSLTSKSVASKLLLERRLRRSPLVRSLFALYCLMSVMTVQYQKQTFASLQPSVMRFSAVDKFIARLIKS